jgi:hypothetical protein
MEEEAVSILNKIVSLKMVSIYDLAESYAREKRTEVPKIFDELTRILFELVSKTLVELKTEEGSDGLETYVKATTTGETYVRSSKIERLLK